MKKRYTPKLKTGVINGAITILFFAVIYSWAFLFPLANFAATEKGSLSNADCGNLTGLYIYDQSDNERVDGLGEITDGTEVNFDDLPANYYLVVEYNGEIGSVEITLDDNSQGEENNPPFTWPNSGESGNNWNGGIGSYNLEAIAYEENGYEEEVCDEINIDFTISDNCGEITGLYIYDAADDNRVDGLGEITQGTDVNIDDLPSNYYLVVETNSEIESVDIELDGNTQPTENLKPFTWPPTGSYWNGGIGSYILEADGYENDDAGGDLCDQINIDFDIVAPCGQIIGLYIYDQSDDERVDGLGEITQGTDVNIDDLPSNYYLVVEAENDIESVDIYLDGSGQSNFENGRPFSWPNNAENNNNWNGDIGSYTLEADGYENDGYGGSLCDQITVDFDIVNDAPSASDDNAVVVENGMVEIPILNNDDFGGDGPASSNYLNIVSNPMHGGVEIIPNGSGASDDEIRYIPGNKYSGPDEFTYEICDATGDCDEATVTIDVEIDCSTSSSFNQDVFSACMQNSYYTVQAKGLLNSSNNCLTITPSGGQKVYAEVYIQESECSDGLPPCIKVSAGGGAYKNAAKIDVINHPNSNVPEAIYRVEFGGISQICIQDPNGCEASSIAVYVKRDGGENATGGLAYVNREVFDESDSENCVTREYGINESGSDREFTFNIPIHESTVTGAEYVMKIKGLDENDNEIYSDVHTSTAPSSNGGYLYDITRTIPGPVVTLEVSICNPTQTGETIGIGMIGIGSTTSCDLLPIAGDDETINHVPGQPATADPLQNDSDPDGQIQANTVNITSSPSGSTSDDTDGDGDIDELIVPGEGTWTTDNESGEITFTPEEGYNDDPTPINYTVQDNNGNETNEGTVTVSYNQALPVVLTRFEVDKKNEKQVLIQWETALEVDFSHFTVERSSDGRSFQNMAEIKPADFFRSGNQYRFTDEHPRPGINYYRLKMVDIDQSFDYSQVKTIVFDQLDQDSPLKVFPSPTSGKLNIEHSNLTGSGELMVIDAYGQRVYREQFDIDPSAGLFSRKIDLHQLATGAYRLVIKDGTSVYSTTFLFNRK